VETTGNYPVVYRTVALILVDALGGIAPPSMGELYKLANRSKEHGAYDRTRYGRASDPDLLRHTPHAADLQGGSRVNRTGVCMRVTSVHVPLD